MHALLVIALLASDIFNVRTFHAVAISPDGKRVAWAEKDHGITVANVDGSNPKQLTTADDEHIAWSPDSAHLAYISKGKLYVDGAALTTVKGALAEPHWSPDGQSIAFLLIENAPRS